MLLLVIGSLWKKILRTAKEKAEDFQIVKLKIGNLTPDVASSVINELKGTFQYSNRVQNAHGLFLLQAFFFSVSRGSF